MNENRSYHAAADRLLLEEHKEHPERFHRYSEEQMCRADDERRRLKDNEAEKFMNKKNDSVK